MYRILIQTPDEKTPDIFECPNEDLDSILRECLKIGKVIQIEYSDTRSQQKDYIGIENKLKLLMKCIEL